MENFFRNPFVITPYVREEYFCDRMEETAQLCKHILNGRNVALFARRRLGKLHSDCLPKFDEIRSYSRN